MHKLILQLYSLLQELLIFSTLSTRNLGAEAGHFFTMHVYVLCLDLGRITLNSLNVIFSWNIKLACTALVLKKLLIMMPKDCLTRKFEIISKRLKGILSLLENCIWRVSALIVIDGFLSLISWDERSGLSTALSESRQWNFIFPECLKKCRSCDILKHFSYSTDIFLLRF